MDDTRRFRGNHDAARTCSVPRMGKWRFNPRHECQDGGMWIPAASFGIEAHAGPPSGRLARRQFGPCQIDSGIVAPRCGESVFTLSERIATQGNPAPHDLLVWDQWNGLRSGPVHVDSVVPVHLGKNGSPGVTGTGGLSLGTDWRTSGASAGERAGAPEGLHPNGIAG